jgi:hypothetical protein
MEVRMNRLDRIEIISEKHGASLAEYVVLDIISNFGMSAEEAVVYASKILHGSPDEKSNCEAAVANCVARSWLRPRGSILVLTSDGSTLRRTIATEVCQLP